MQVTRRNHSTLGRLGEWRFFGESYSTDSEGNPYLASPQHWVNLDTYEVSYVDPTSAAYAKIHAAAPPPTLTQQLTPNLIGLAGGTQGNTYGTGEEDDPRIAGVVALIQSLLGPDYRFSDATLANIKSLTANIVRNGGWSRSNTAPSIFSIIAQQAGDPTLLAAYNLYAATPTGAAAKAQWTALGEEKMPSGSIGSTLSDIVSSAAALMSGPGVIMGLPFAWGSLTTLAESAAGALTSTGAANVAPYIDPSLSDLATSTFTASAPASATLPEVVAQSAGALPDLAPELALTPAPANVAPYIDPSLTDLAAPVVNAPAPSLSDLLNVPTPPISTPGASALPDPIVSTPGSLPDLAPAPQTPPVAASVVSDSVAPGFGSTPAPAGAQDYLTQYIARPIVPPAPSVLDKIAAQAQGKAISFAESKIIGAGAAALGLGAGAGGGGSGFTTQLPGGSPTAGGSANLPAGFTLAYGPAMQQLALPAIILALAFALT